MSPRGRGRALACALLVAAGAGPARAAAPRPAPGTAADRGVWFEGRLWAGMPWATYDYGVYGVFASTPATISPFAVGYKLGRLYLALGFDVSRVTDGSYGPGTATVGWLGPTCGYVLLPPAYHRPSLYVEGALHLVLGDTRNTSVHTRIRGLGARLAGGTRAFFLPDVGIGLEAGVAFDRIHLDVKGNNGPVIDDFARYGFYGAVTLVVIVP